MLPTRLPEGRGVFGVNFRVAVLHGRLGRRRDRPARPDGLGNDVNKRMQNKQLSSLDYPQVLTLTFNYTTQKNKFGGDGAGGKTLQWLSSDWTFGGVLRYQSGMLLESPSANNNFLFQMGVGSQDNPAVFSSPQGIENYVPGQPFFLVNPESRTST